MCFITPWILCSLHILLHITHHLSVLALPIVSPSWCQGFKTTFPVHLLRALDLISMSAKRMSSLAVLQTPPPQHFQNQNPSLAPSSAHTLVIPASVNALPAALCFTKIWASVYQGLTECRLQAMGFQWLSLILHQPREVAIIFTVIPIAQVKM